LGRKKKEKREKGKQGNLTASERPVSVWAGMRIIGKVL